MKIKTLGFEWNLEFPQVDANALCAAIKTKSDADVKHLSDSIGGAGVGAGTFMVTSFKNNWLIGVVIKVRDIRALMTLIEEQGTTKLKPKHLAGKEAAVEVNFFVFNPVRSRGLYQYYHQSTWLDSFCRKCKDIYDFEVDVVRRALESSLKASGALEIDVQKEMKKHAGKSLKYSILVEAKDLQRLTSDLGRIKSLEVECATDVIKRKSALAPISSEADRKVEKFVFFDRDKSNLTLVKKIADGLGNLIKAAAARKVRVTGVTPGGHEAIYKLEDNYQSFAEYEYDAVADDVIVDLSDASKSLSDSKMIEALLDIGTKNSLFK